MIQIGRALAGSAARRFQTLALVAALVAPAGLFAASDMSKSIPKDALAAAWTNDFAALREGGKVSPYGKLWNDPGMDKVRLYVDQQFKKMQEERGEKEFAELNEVVDLVKGGLAVYMKPNGETFDPKNLSFTGMVEIDEKGKAWLDEKLKDFGKDLKDAKKDSFETNGVTVYRVKGFSAGDTPELVTPDPASPDAATTPAATPAADLKEVTMQYAYVDNKYFVYSDSKNEEVVKEAVNMLKSPSSDKAISGRDDVKLAEEKAKSTDAQFHLFIDTNTLITKFIENDPNAEAEVKAALPKTGLYDLKSVNAIVTMGEKSMDLDIGIGMPVEKNGIVKAVFAAGPTPLKMVKNVPTGVLNFTSFSLDLGAIYDETMKLVEEFNPQASAFVNMQIASASSQYEVDIVNSIVKNISGEHLIVNNPLNDEIKKQMDTSQAALTSSDAYFFGLKNGDQVVTSLKTLLANLKKNPDSADSFTMEEKDGVTVVMVKGFSADESPIKPIIAFNKDAIVYTNNEVELQNAIRALNGKITDAMANNDAYKKVAADVKKDGLYSFTYSPKGSVRAAIRQLKEMADQGFFNSVEGFNPDMIPTAEVAEKYFGDSYSSVTFEDKMLSVKTKVQAATTK